MTGGGDRRPVFLLGVLMDVPNKEGEKERQRHTRARDRREAVLSQSRPKKRPLPSLGLPKTTPTRLYPLDLCRPFPVLVLFDTHTRSSFFRTHERDRKTENEKGPHRRPTFGDNAASGKARGRPTRWAECANPDPLSFVHTFFEGKKEKKSQIAFSFVSGSRQGKGGSGKEGSMGGATHRPCKTSSHGQ